MIAGNVGLAGYMVSRLQVMHFVPHFQDLPGEFVPQYMG
jgi:hypothetical protein